MTENDGLRREIGVWGLASNSINIIIGAGIFVLPAIVAARLGAASILAYLICGVLIMLIMLCFAEIGSKITITGGAYSYIEVAFGKYAGFITTNIFIVAAIMANAAVANALADTISYFIPVFKTQWIRVLFFITMFTGLAYLNVRGIKKGMLLVKFNTIAKLTPLLFIAFFGWIWFSPSNLTWTVTPSLLDLGEVSLILIFAFIGAETSLNVSGEIKNPKKTIPKGIMLSMLIVVTLYMLIQVSAQGVLGGSLADFKDAPLAEVGKNMIGPIGATLVIFGAFFSMFGNLSGMVLNMPRILFAAARDNVIPVKNLAKIHSSYSTPHVAIIGYATLACFFACTGEFKQLAILASASYLLIYLGVVLAVIKYRVTKQDEAGGFKIPGGYAIPVFSTAAILWFLSNLPANELTAMLIFLVLLSLIYLVTNFLRKKSA